jgi:hypothetical protein
MPILRQTAMKVRSSPDDLPGSIQRTHGGGEQP